MRASTAAVAFFIGVLLGTVTIGCRNDGPVSPESSPVATQEPDFLKLPKSMSLQKIVADTALITPEQGGKLSLAFRYRYTSSTGDQKLLDARMTLTFPRGAVEDSIVASLRLDDEVLRSTVDITFNPHGATFLKPALLDVDIRGMDLSEFSPHDRIWLYYDDNGVWVKMVAKMIYCDVREGRIKCDDGQLPHFSRYAFGR